MKLMALLLFIALSGAAQNAQDAFNKPFPPYKVMGNIYFVGTGALGSFLITTPAGNILM